MSRDDERRRRRPYHKPELHVVELEAGEVLGEGCKTSSGPNNVGYPACGINQSCVLSGS